MDERQEAEEGEGEEKEEKEKEEEEEGAGKPANPALRLRDHEIDVSVVTEGLYVPAVQSFSSLFPAPAADVLIIERRC